MKDYIILLQADLRLDALQWVGEAANEDEAYDKFVSEESTFDSTWEKREDFSIIQVTRRERLTIEAFGDVQPDHPKINLNFKYILLRSSL
jgi:hypothetical protein